MRASTPRRTAIAIFLAISALLSGCTINGTRALNEDCLQNRECVEGLSCQPRTDGRYVCLPVSEAGTVFVTDAAVDAPADVTSDTADASSTDAAGE